MALDAKATPVLLQPPSTFPSSTSTTSSGGIFNRVQDIYNSLQYHRASLGLSNPGTVENVSKEVQRDVFLNNSHFSGLRADITKAFSVSPLFQISHSLSMGSQAQSPYAFSALYGSSKIFMQGNIDSDLSLSGRFNYRWTEGLISKASVQIQGPTQAMLSLENDYTGPDFTAQIKAMNPSIFDGGLTGIFIGSYLQSITPSLALGLEGMWQRAAVTHGPEINLSYAARYKGRDWIASGQLLAQGAVQAAYWKRITDRVEAGIDVSLQFAGINANPMMGGGAEGTTTIGTKYDFRQSSFRAQVDSNGRVAALLEKRVAQAVQVTFSGEIDHSKNTAKVGLAVSVEAAGDEVMEQQEKLSEAPAIPF